MKYDKGNKPLQILNIFEYLKRFTNLYPIKINKSFSGLNSIKINIINLLHIHPIKKNKALNGKVLTPSIYTNKTTIE